MEILILLPDTIYINKMIRNQDIVTKPDEYNIYYKNIIQPYNEAWDIVIDCEIGKNLGHVWRLSNYLGEESEFDFELSIYDEYGKKLASKKSRIVLGERNIAPKQTKWMAIGDSMTYAQQYIDHVTKKLMNIKTVGTRSVDCNIYHEGRGGWAYKQYLNSYFYEFGLSPFLFPKGIAGKDYYGNMEFAEVLKKGDFPTYPYLGYPIEEISDGMYFTENKMLYRLQNGKKDLIDEAPEFEFDFVKYMERFNIETPDFVSLLMGANDLQVCPYGESEERINTYIENTKYIVDKIHEADSGINVVICLPVLGAEQYSWGMQLNCMGTEKMYRFNIMHASKKLLEVFDNRQNENIYIAPMIMCLDPIHGFDYDTVKANMYSESSVRVHSNWVHPNRTGYCQMGDAIASVIEYVRNKNSDF